MEQRRAVEQRLQLDLSRVIRDVVTREGDVASMDASQRKRCESLPAGLGRTLSPVRFESNSCGNAPISCNFESNADGFLYTSDCVAERKEFEPSVQL